MYLSKYCDYNDSDDLLKQKILHTEASPLLPIKLIIA